MSTAFRESIRNFASTVRAQKQVKLKITDQLKLAMAEAENTSLRLVRSPEQYTVKSSVGKGNWAGVCWIAILDKSVTDTPQRGYYISMLFNNDLTQVYIGLGLGVTAYTSGTRLMDKHVQALREKTRSVLSNPHELIWDGSLDFGVDTSLAKSFARATVFTKKFNVDEIPDDDQISTHFNEIIKAHDAGIELLRLMQSEDINPDDGNAGKTSHTFDNKNDLTPSDFLLWDEQKEHEALSLWGRKRNLILQGPPGVGKTFWSKKFASMANECDARYSGLTGMGAPPKYIYRCQFHQSMSYEDFVEGYRPTPDGGFKLTRGIFLNAAFTALDNPNETVVLIIDEINRGNLSKILGELLSLIESDKRTADWATKLTYSNTDFWVPDNLYILGMMNTADRSISLVDYALRRRFGFINVEPDFDNSAFHSLLQNAGASEELITKIVKKLGHLNQTIENAPHLGPGFRIGHSYFISAEFSPAEDAIYKQIINYEVKPLLEEYWFDDLGMVDQLVGGLLAED